MKDFTFYNPVRVEFGADKENHIGEYMAPYGVKKALIVFGSDRIKKSGLFDRVVKSLTEAGISYVELGGIKSNPVMAPVRQGVEICRAEGVDAVLAVGGGSVLDSAKFIAAGAKYDGDAWDFASGKAAAQEALHIFDIMTLAATGSEMNCGAVVMNEDTLEKLGGAFPCMFPKVSVVNPELQNTVTADYLAYSAVDVFAHSLDLYFSATTISDFNLRLVENILKTVMETTETLLKNPQDTVARGEFAWAATMALNGVTFVGAEGNGYPSHVVEHSLSAIYDIAHGAGLGICLPAWMRFQAQFDQTRFERLAREVFGVEGAEAGIEAMAQWFKKIGAPITLADANIPESDIPAIVDNCFTMVELFGFGEVFTKDVITGILNYAK